MLELTGVSASYGDRAIVKDVDLTIADGEVVALLGPSGSGKSTLLRLIAGLLPVGAGRILLDGRDVSRTPAAARGIGMVFQEHALFTHMTVFENVAYGLRRRRWRADRIAARVDAMLDLIGLPDVAARRPHQLSGGQRQRVALARALAFEPSLLLMDEPLGALDRDAREQMQQAIGRVHRETRASILYVTHDRGEALALSRRMAIVDHGRVVACDTAQALYACPPNRFVAAFFGDRHLFAVDVDAIDIPAGRHRIRLFGQVGSIAGGGPVDRPGPAVLAVAARHIKPGASPDEGIVVTVRVIDRLDMEGRTRLLCEHMPSGERIAVELESPGVAIDPLAGPIELTISLAQARLVPADAAG